MSGLMAKIFPQAKFANKMLPPIGEKEQLKQLMPYMTEYIALKMASWGNNGRNLMPGCMFGPLPLYAVTNMEAGKSDKQLRYRSIGGQFLAYQEGDNVSLRVDLTLSGDSRFVYLSMLDGLYVRGLATFKVREFRNMTATAEANAGPLLGTLSSSYNPATANCTPVLVGAASMVQAAAPLRGTLPMTGAVTAANNPNPYLTDDITINRGQWRKQGGTTREIRGNVPESNDPWKEVEWWQRRERIITHKTFPVITEEEIFSRMYIESMFWRKTVGTNGRNDITVNLLLRRYVEPPEKMFLETREPVQEKIRGNNCTESKLSKGRSPKGTEMLEKAPDEAVTAAKGKLSTKRFLRLISTGGKVAPMNPSNLGASVAVPGGNNYRDRNGVLKYTDTREQDDKEAYYVGHVAASAVEIAEPRNLVKSEEDDYAIAYYKPHGYVATIADNRIPGDYAMLAVNMLWRSMITGSNMVINGFNGKAISTDPVIGRTLTIVKAYQQANATMPSSSGSVVATESLQPTSTTVGRNIYLENALATMGISIPSGKTFQDIMNIPGRQKTFEDVILSGCDMKKFTGSIPIKGTMSFTSPIQMTWYVYLNTSPYGNPVNVYVSLQGYRMLVTPGSVYFLGTPDKPTWKGEHRGGYIVTYCNKSPRDEIYLYVKSLDMVNENVNVEGIIIMPSRGVN